MGVTAAIAAAEAILPGSPAPDDEVDPRWRAIVEIGEFIDSNPGQVWAFTRRWGSCEQEDLQAAIATCLLEHLLEFDFEAYFPLAAAQAKQSPTFARTLSMTWVFGRQSPEQRRIRQFLDSLRAP